MKRGARSRPGSRSARRRGRAARPTWWNRATFDASVSLLNIDSPKKTRPSSRPYRPPDEPLARATPRRSGRGRGGAVRRRRRACRARSRCPRMRARRCPRIATLPPRRPGRTSRGNRDCAGSCAGCALTRSSSGNSTMRGSGDHHRIGWPSAYQGKMPRRYAARMRSGPRSPPAQSSPSGSSSAPLTGGNASGGSDILSQGITRPSLRAARWNGTCSLASAM